MSLTLHYHPLASYCWKALIALYENDIPFTPNLVDLGNPAERAALVKLWGSANFRAATRRGTRQCRNPASSSNIWIVTIAVPLGSFLTIPAAPCRRGCTTASTSLRALPADAKDHDRPDAASDKRDPLSVEEARAQLRTSYAQIEQQMAKGGWAVGEDFSLVDCAAAPSLFYGSMVVPFGDANKNLSAYFERAEGLALLCAGDAESGAVFPDGAQRTLRRRR